MLCVYGWNFCISLVFFVLFFYIIIFTPPVLGTPRMLLPQRNVVVQHNHSLAAGEQQEAYRWVPCPGRTRIARRQMRIAVY